MAHRDSGQGFGFMYVDISKLLKQRDELAKGEKDETTPILTENVVTANFNKDRKPMAKTASPATPDVSSVTGDKSAAIKQIRDNLDRLQALHHKLHAMLEELNRVTNKTPKSNS
jgi:hypothetical protein